MASSPVKRVFITGASGFLGGACLEEFLTRGWQVTAMIHRRKNKRLQELAAADKIQLVNGSICDPIALERCLATSGEITALVHCAGRATDIGRERQFRRANLEGVANLLTCLASRSGTRLVHISTTDVYGVRDFSDATEETPPTPHPVNPYPKYKILAEQLIRDNLGPNRWVILRPALVWGPGDTTVTPRVIDFLRRSPWIIHFGRWRGRNRWPLAHITNVSRLARLVAEVDEAPGQTYNIADREHTSMDEYYRLLMTIYLPRRKPPPSLNLPFWLGYCLGRASTTLSSLLGRDHPLVDPSHYGLLHVTADQHFNGTKGEQLLHKYGLSPISREEAIRQLHQMESTTGMGRA